MGSDVSTAVIKDAVPLKPQVWLCDVHSATSCPDEHDSNVPVLPTAQT